MITTNQLMRPILETAAATAWRLRRRLHDLHPQTTFQVTTKRPRGVAELHVSWTGGPTAETIASVAEVFARTVDGRQADATLWADAHGNVALIYPGAEHVRLRRRSRQ
ncbi:MAG: LPD29 domain-containing protein [Patulibacter sp.]|nr:LPD29 domain-containing protein [Patulibacter sp.]